MALNSLGLIREKNNAIYERLGRGWTNVEWLTLFPESKLTHLPRVASDHCPIFLSLENKIQNVGDKPFRFEPMWTLDPRFLRVIDQA